MGAEQVRQLAGRREQALEVQPQLWIGRLRSAPSRNVGGVPSGSHGPSDTSCAKHLLLPLQLCAQVQALTGLVDELSV